MKTELPPPIRWLGNKVEIIDQSLLPHTERYISSNDYRQVCEWIKSLRIRGAPAIGIAAAYAAALAAFEFNCRDKISSDLETALEEIADTRPTAVNIKKAIDRLRKLYLNGKKVGEAFLLEAHKILVEETNACMSIGRYGNALVPHRAVIHTHCHTGGLATGGYGTALGVIRAAHESGKEILVIVDETRPLLQGSRLTAWELQKLGIKFKLIVDGAAGIAMKKFGVNMIITGADRIASNGDTANKVGTYNLSVLSKEHGIPFYIAAPSSSFDLSISSGEEIPIEERGSDEIISFGKCKAAPDGIETYSPAFDVTPAENITAFITERGIIKRPFYKNIIRILR
ncbi:MAG: S-methyl-5-thioribose-1-phosphate isomerase [Candidatus Kryptoniota bacterium]